MRYSKVLALVLLFVVLSMVGSITYLLSPADASDDEKREITIEEGMSRSEVAGLLSKEGLIRSQFAFFIYNKLTNSIILPGIYELSASDSSGTISSLFTEGKFKVVRVTIKEGWWASDIEEELVENKFMTQMAGFADKAKVYEGYLFPDTYEIKVDAKIEQVVALLGNNFEKRTEGLEIDPDVVILASIVEREAKGPSDRAAIAGVYLNRLKIGMRLEADATVQYAKGSSRAIVTVSDYSGVISPYNTYLNDGFPPGAISNPGLESIKAVLNPENHDYLFYFHAQGETFFSRTHEEHRAKVRKYF